MFNEVERIIKDEEKRVSGLVTEGRKQGMTDSQMLESLVKILAETSFNAILDGKAAARREADYQKQLKNLSNSYNTLVQERKQIVEMLTKEGLYYPETKEEEGLPFWISGLLCRLERLC